jgi:HSP20 family molecular chaperone IbpA
MLKKRCNSCAEKVDRKFNYCPHCGASFKASKNNRDFGMLGRDDSEERIQEDMRLPFGMEKMVGSLIRQLEKQMNNLDLGEGQGMPKGIKIRVARGPPMRQISKVPEKRRIVETFVSPEENERRISLPKVNAESKVRRLADSIIYEIEAPGIRKKEDVVLTELATGLEIKAYSDKKCYVKFIPLKVEVARYSVGAEKVFIELRG